MSNDLGLSIIAEGVENRGTTIAQVVERHIGNVEVTGPTPVSSSFLMSGFIYTVFTSNGLSDTVFTIVPVLYQWFFTDQINSCQTHHRLHSFFMPTDSNLFRIHQAAKNSGSFQWHSIITGSKRRTTVMHRLYTVLSFQVFSYPFSYNIHTCNLKGFQIISSK